MRIYDWPKLNAAQKAEVLQRAPAPKNLRQRVADIIDDVRRRGDEALLEFSKRFDRVQLERLEVQLDQKVGSKSVSEPFKEAIEVARQTISTFHAAQRPQKTEVETLPGVRCARHFAPLSSVGLYIPGGTAPLPSTVLMLGIPAALAEVPTRILCTPPNQEGGVDPHILYAAQVAGVQRVFTVGGAQAVSAMAYGTETIPKVDKIFGPGNPWVTEAKVSVSLDPKGAAIDMPAGPSELMVVADQHADWGIVAADLLSQAEHGADSQVLLVLVGNIDPAPVIAEIDQQCQQLPRKALANQALEHSRIITCAERDQAQEIVEAYAPEHLSVQVDQPQAFVKTITRAGSIFVGPWSAESFGDYAAGTNHVLPTAGFASAYSGVSLTSFMRSYTTQEITPEGLRALGPHVETLARAESLEAHARAVTLRLQRIGEKS